MIGYSVSTVLYMCPHFDVNDSVTARCNDGSSLGWNLGEEFTADKPPHVQAILS
jgi:hypothetical protein